uniref:non-specific serine/threonine protein kinase n=1 Tax=Paramoeba aestuarina TaxID=180227 RepID=A0A7S4UGQ0_9EUKA|mmetsp:Transcript_4428/g.6644  ORF Transcript_4428/g.6644 Transcript_4428/m.6644 type:complete len:728 (+) Transcript_4428:36-2219(+)
MSKLLGVVEGVKNFVDQGVRKGFSTEEVRLYYDFHEQLGSGFFAKVYRATEKKTGQVFAIKQIDKAKAGKSEMLQDEVDILNKVNHQNTVNMYEIFEGEKNVYLVMELVTGGELFDQIVELKTFDEGLCAKIVTEILQGLQYLHSLGIVHRDLKPQNILLSSPNVREATIKITDFGLSKIAAKGKFLHSQCGTPAFAAPELIEAKPYNEKVDLWAVGCILYALLSGQPPFRGETVQEIYHNICMCNYSLNTPQLRSCSALSKLFIKKLLCPKHENRPSAAEALQDKWLKKYMTAHNSGEKLESLQMQDNMRRFQVACANGELSAEPPLKPSRKASTVGPSGVPTKPKRGGKGEEEKKEGGPVVPAKSFSQIGRLTLSDSQGSSGESMPAMTSSRDSDEEKGVFGAKTPRASLKKMEEKYPNWPFYNSEFERGNLLGCKHPSQIRQHLNTQSPWKRRAYEAGFLRPFLLLCAMHPRQRLGCGAAVGLDLTSNLWYGDVHREAWEIIGNSCNGIRAKTTKLHDKEQCWWETMLQVADKTVAHFEIEKQKGKEHFKAMPKWNHEQALQACQNVTNTDVSDLEEIFLELIIKKVMAQMGIGNSSEQGSSSHGGSAVSFAGSFKFKNSADMTQNATGEEKQTLEMMQKEFKRTSLIVKFINFYGAEVYKTPEDRVAFEHWAEKERKPTLRAVFLNNLPVRSLLPVVFSILAQRLFLSAIGIFIKDFAEIEKE